MNSKVDKYISITQRWQKEIETLRKIVLNCPLAEELKWGIPVYTFMKKNIVGINGFKEYCALAFFKGALLKDDFKILVQPGTVQSGRYIPFTSVKEIVKMEPILKAYIYEAIDLEKAGLKVPLKNITDYIIPIEFQIKLDENKTLKKAFKTLTPGRQKGYIVFFSQPKLAKTREIRVEKCIPYILNGKGLDD